MNPTLALPAAAVDKLFANDCRDCRTEPYVTARLAFTDAKREAYCRPCAEKFDADGLLTVRSARRIG
jgi:hypothetical protein